MSERQRYTPELAVGLQVVSDAWLAPDGARVAFVVAPTGHAETIPTSTIWLADLDGDHSPCPFTGGSSAGVEDRSPRWSPDGRTLAFLSDRAERGTVQLHVIDAGGGEARPLTSLPRGLDLIGWSPDGAWLTGTADRRALAGEEQPPASDIRVASQAARPRVIVRVARDGGALEAIGPAEGHVWSYAWRGDGGQIAALTTATELLAETAGDVRLLLIDPASGAERVLTTLQGLPAALHWSPDGASLVAIGDLPGVNDDTRVFLIDAQSGAVRPLDAGEATPIWVAWLPRAPERLLVLSQAGLTNRLDLVDVADGASHQVHTLPEDSCGLPPLSLSADGRTLALTVADAQHPAEVWAGPLEGTLRPVSRLNAQLDAVELAPMEPVAWPASDGLTIQGWLLRPPGAGDGPLPLVVQVHGGPTARWGATFHGTWHDWGQVLAAAGYAVLLPNPRGSTGRGQAFTAANHDDLGGMDFDDVLRGVDWLIEQGIADPERLAIAGWSYGGFLTAWAVGHTDRFKAAVAGAAVTNWPSKVGTTDIRPMNEYRFPGALHEAPDAFWERSPVRYLGNITTPTLVVHGDADQRVPVSQGFEFYQGLRAAGVPTDFIVYPRQKHAFHERAHQQDLLERIVAWIGRWLG